MNNPAEQLDALAAAAQNRSSATVPADSMLLQFQPKLPQQQQHQPAQPPTYDQSGIHSTGLARPELQRTVTDPYAAIALTSDGQFRQLQSATTAPPLTANNSNPKRPIRRSVSTDGMAKMKHSSTGRRMSASPRSTPKPTVSADNISGLTTAASFDETAAKQIRLTSPRTVTMRKKKLTEEMATNLLLLPQEQQEQPTPTLSKTMSDLSSSSGKQGNSSTSATKKKRRPRSSSNPLAKTTTTSDLVDRPNMTRGSSSDNTSVTSNDSNNSSSSSTSSSTSNNNKSKRRPRARSFQGDGKKMSKVVEEEEEEKEESPQPESTKKVAATKKSKTSSPLRSKQSKPKGTDNNLHVQQTLLSPKKQMSPKKRVKPKVKSAAAPELNLNNTDGAAVSKPAKIKTASNTRPMISRTFSPLQILRTPSSGQQQQQLSSYPEQSAMVVDGSRSSSQRAPRSIDGSNRSPRATSPDGRRMATTPYNSHGKFSPQRPRTVSPKPGRRGRVQAPTTPATARAQPHPLSTAATPEPNEAYVNFVAPPQRTSSKKGAKASATVQNSMRTLPNRTQSDVLTQMASASRDSNSVRGRSSSAMPGARAASPRRLSMDVGGNQRTNMAKRATRAISPERKMANIKSPANDANRSVSVPPSSHYANSNMAGVQAIGKVGMPSKANRQESRGLKKDGASKRVARTDGSAVSQTSSHSASTSNTSLSSSSTIPSNASSANNNLDYRSPSPMPLKRGDKTEKQPRGSKATSTMQLDQSGLLQSGGANVSTKVPSRKPPQRYSSNMETISTHRRKEKDATRPSLEKRAASLGGGLKDTSSESPDEKKRHVIFCEDNNTYRDNKDYFKEDCKSFWYKGIEIRGFKTDAGQTAQKVLQSSDFGTQISSALEQAYLSSYKLEQGTKVNVISKQELDELNQLYVEHFDSMLGLERLLLPKLRNDRTYLRRGFFEIITEGQSNDEQLQDGMVVKEVTRESPPRIPTAKKQKKTLSGPNQHGDTISAASSELTRAWRLFALRLAIAQEPTIMSNSTQGSKDKNTKKPPPPSSAGAAAAASAAE